MQAGKRLMSLLLWFLPVSPPFFERLARKTEPLHSES